MAGRADVSVVIPHYEAVRTLERAIASVSAQTVLPVEVIIVDDASSPDTQRAIRDLVSRVRPFDVHLVVLAENSGPGAARNAGWDVAMGSLVAFLDADDSWSSSKLEIQASLFAGDSPFDAIGHRCGRADSTLDLGPAPGEGVGDGLHARLPREWLRRNHFATSSVMVRRDLPYRFSMTGRYAEDYDLWLRMAFGGCTMGVLEMTLAQHYKEPFGGSGLSAHLWLMERGELEALRGLRRCNLVSTQSLVVAMAFSLVKFGVRVSRVAFRMARHS